ncbi:MAG: hypothetical protein IPH10_08700 [bacterium]|nr:hypothetical protein [bacterium]
MKKMLALCFALVSLQSLAIAQSSWNMSQLWSMGPWWDRSFDVEVEGNFAYVADHSAGLWIVNVATPSSPVAVGHLDTKETSWGLAVRGNYVYLADGFAGMRIIDVSNPSSPFELSTVPISSQTYDVTLDPVQDIAYVAGWGSGVRIINVANPNVPVQLGFFDTPNECNDIELSGNIAYVADSWDGLLILHFANPAAPTAITTFAFPGTRTVDVELNGSLAYVLAGGTVYVLNIANPAAPALIDSCVEPTDPSEITLRGSYAFVSDNWGVMHVLDISDPQHPQHDLYIGTNGSAPAIAVNGDYAYVAATDGGLCIADISNPVAPFTTAFPATHVNGQDVAKQGNVVIVANRQLGWRVLNVSNPASPVELANVPAIEATNGCDFVGQTAFIASEGAGLLIYDMNNPAAPSLVGQYDSPGIALDVTVVGSTAYLCDAFAGLQILDISNLSSPILLGSYDTPDWAQDVEIRGSFAYVCDGYADLRILDITTPTAPYEVSFVDGDNAQAIAFKDNYAFVATGHVVQVIDISNPLAPFQATTFPISWTRDLTLVGNLLFVAASEHVLHAYDISNPLAATEVGYFSGNGVALAVLVSDSIAYVSDRVYLRNIDVSDVLAYTGPRPCLSCTPVDENLGTIPEAECGASISGNLLDGGKWTASFTGSMGEVFHWDLCSQAPCGGQSSFHTGDPDLLILDSDCNILVWEDGPGGCGYAPNDFQWTCPATGTYYVVIEPYNGVADLHCGGDENDRFTMNYYREPVSLTTGQCCYNSGNSCANITESDCASFGGIWDSTQVCLGCGCNSSTQEWAVDENTTLLLHFNGTPNGAAGEVPTQATGITYSPARFYDGALLSTGDQLRFNATGNITATQGTLECWLKPEWNGNDNTTHMILAWGSGGGLLMSKDGANNLRIILNRFSAGGQPEQGVSINIGSWIANQWHHVAFSWNASAIRVYVDGSLMSQNPVTIPLPNIASSTFQIGGEGAGSYLRAQVDEFRFSSSVRTEQEVAQSYINGLAILSLAADPTTMQLYPTWSVTPTLTALTDVGTRTLPATLATWSSSNPSVATVTAAGLVGSPSRRHLLLLRPINATMRTLRCMSPHRLLRLFGKNWIHF